VLRVSATTGAGIDDLVTLLRERVATCKAMASR
jgi:hypothetical protein